MEAGHFLEVGTLLGIERFKEFSFAGEGAECPAFGGIIVLVAERAFFQFFREILVSAVGCKP